MVKGGVVLEEQEDRATAGGMQDHWEDKRQEWLLTPLYYSFSFLIYSTFSASKNEREFFDRIYKN